MAFALGTIRFRGFDAQAPVVNAAVPALDLGAMHWRGLDCVVAGPLNAVLGTIHWRGLNADIADARLHGALLEWQTSGGTALALLDTLGTIDGVEITDTAGRGGVGVGALELRIDADGAPWLAWRGPNSPAYGDPVPVAAGGAFVLADGTDGDTWVAVDVTPDRLPSLSVGATVRVADVVNGGLTAGDVSAGDALGGITVTTQLLLYNRAATSSLATLSCWLAPGTRFVTLSFDNATYAAPTSEAAALAALGSVTITGHGTHALYVRRIIPAATAAAALEPLQILASWDDGAGGRGQATARDQYRIANAAVYRLYIREDERPVPGLDAIVETSATLPWTPAHVFTAGVWFLAVAWFDGMYESAAVFTRLEIAGVAQVGNPPSAPDRFWIEQEASGQVYVRALYSPVSDEEADLVADTFALWYTTDGSAPGSGTANDTAAADTTGVLATAKFDLGTLADGTDLRVLVRMRLGAVDSENEEDSELIVTIAAPDATPGAKAVRATDAVRA